MSPVIYWDARKLKLKLVANSHDNNFIHGCPIESRNISTRSKLKTETHRKLKQPFFPLPLCCNRCQMPQFNWFPFSFSITYSILNLLHSIFSISISVFFLLLTSLPLRSHRPCTSYLSTHTHTHTYIYMHILFTFY